MPILAEYALKKAGEDPQGFLVSEAVTVFVPVGDGVSAEVQELAVRAQLQAVDDIARPLVDKYLDGVLEQAGIRPSGERPSPGQIAYILDLARERKMSRKALAALVREVSGAEFEIPPRTGADEVAALIAGAVNRLQASRLIDRLK